MRFITRTTSVLFVALLLCACVNLPIHNDGIDDPALAKISRAFEQTVEAAHNDPNTQWQSGWLGNMWIHFSDEEQRGLCYEWKFLVHDGVADTVHQVGWQIRGIAINEGTKHEHHAVVVYDPTKISSADILKAADTAPAYVLDAWRQGKADIYTVKNWLASNFHTSSPARVFLIKQDVTYN